MQDYDFIKNTTEQDFKIASNALLTHFKDIINILFDNNFIQIKL